MRSAIVDCETTGLDPRTGQLTEVAVLHVEQGQVVARWSTLIRPSVGRVPWRGGDSVIA